MRGGGLAVERAGKIFFRVSLRVRDGSSGGGKGRENMNAKDRDSVERKKALAD